MLTHARVVHYSYLHHAPTHPRHVRTSCTDDIRTRAIFSGHIISTHTRVQHEWERRGWIRDCRGTWVQIMIWTKSNRKILHMMDLFVKNDYCKTIHSGRRNLASGVKSEFPISPSSPKRLSLDVRHKRKLSLSLSTCVNVKHFPTLCTSNKMPKKQLMVMTLDRWGSIIQLCTHMVKRKEIYTKPSQIFFSEISFLCRHEHTRMYYLLQGTKSSETRTVHADAELRMKVVLTGVIDISLYLSRWFCFLFFFCVCLFSGCKEKSDGEILEYCRVFGSRRKFCEEWFRTHDRGRIKTLYSLTISL